YARGDVFTASVHGDPAGFYPWFNGQAVERGAGPGEGANLNIALPLGTDDAAWLAAVKSALGAVMQHRPDVMVVSAGFDVHRDDPLGAFSVTTAAIGAAAERLADAGVPAVIVQEGGYMSDALTANAAAFLSPFRASSTGRSA
ncbi:MAG: histone deacetylase family protein, partial [Pseudomonadota bacterium]